MAQALRKVALRGGDDAFASNRPTRQKGLPATTLASFRQPTGPAIPVFVCVAILTALRTAAWADTDGGIETLATLIALAGFLVTAVLVFLLVTAVLASLAQRADSVVPPWCC